MEAYPLNAFISFVHFFCLGTAFPLLLLAAVSKLLTEVLREDEFPLAYSSREAAHGGRRMSSRVQGGVPNCTCSQGAERAYAGAQLAFSFLFSPGPQP